MVSLNQYKSHTIFKLEKKTTLRSVNEIAFLNNTTLFFFHFQGVKFIPKSSVFLLWVLLH